MNIRKLFLTKQDLLKSHYVVFMSYYIVKFSLIIVKACYIFDIIADIVQQSISYV